MVLFLTDVWFRIFHWCSYFYKASIYYTHYPWESPFCSETFHCFSQLGSWYGIKKSINCITFWEEIRIILNKRKVFLIREIREKAILPFGHLMYWFLKASTLSITRRTTQETLLYVTLNRSAISRVVSWFVMHHKKIETCFRASKTCLRNGFPTGNTPVATTSSLRFQKWSFSYGSDFEIHL